MQGAFFGSDYRQSRLCFLERVERLDRDWQGVEVEALSVPSRTDDDLFVDLCYVPARRRPRRLLIFSSGVHGVEGFVGSAMQQLFIDEYVRDDLLAETGLLFLHMLNPFGAKYLRRVTENNVDLNRNCDLETTLAENLNPAYEKVHSLLNPAGPVNLSAIGSRLFFLKVIRRIVGASLAGLRQAILQGQYSSAESLFFGGHRYEPQVDRVRPWLVRCSGNYEMIVHIDLHSGYGQRGKLHLFPNAVGSPDVRSGLSALFPGVPIDWGGSDDFYTVTGDFAGLMLKLAPEKTVLPVVFEYGTLDSQTLMGAIRSLHNMVVESQGFRFGFASEKDRCETCRRFVEMFNPGDASWQARVMAQTRDRFRLLTRSR